MQTEKLPFWVDFVAGCIGGAAQVLTAQPFDIIKVRLQIQDLNNPKYTGMFNCFNKIRKQEGLLSFYKGTLVPLLAAGLLSTNRFILFQTSQRYINHELLDNDKKNYLSSFYLSGALAGSLTTILATPVEHSRIRVQKQSYGTAQTYSGSLCAATKIFNEFGIRGVYKGFLATFIKDGIFYGNFFFFFELISRFLKRKNPERNLKDIEILGAGGLSGIFNWMIVFPFDTLKSLHQTDCLSNPFFRNYRHIIQHTYRTSGVMSLYRGFPITLVRAVPVNACTFYMFETSKTFFSNFSGRGAQKMKQ